MPINQEQKSQLKQTVASIFKDYIQVAAPGHIDGLISEALITIQDFLRNPATKPDLTTFSNAEHIGRALDQLQALVAETKENVEGIINTIIEPISINYATASTLSDAIYSPLQMSQTQKEAAQKRFINEAAAYASEGHSLEFLSVTALQKAINDAGHSLTSSSAEYQKAFSYSAEKVEEALDALLTHLIEENVKPLGTNLPNYMTAIDNQKTVLQDLVKNLENLDDSTLLTYPKELHPALQIINSLPAFSLGKRENAISYIQDKASEISIHYAKAFELREEAFSIILDKDPSQKAFIREATKFVRNGYSIDSLSPQRLSKNITKLDPTTTPSSTYQSEFLASGYIVETFTDIDHGFMPSNRPKILQPRDDIQNRAGVISQKIFYVRRQQVTEAVSTSLQGKAETYYNEVRNQNLSKAEKERYAVAYVIDTSDIDNLKNGKPQILQGSTDLDKQAHIYITRLIAVEATDIIRRHAKDEHKEALATDFQNKFKQHFTNKLEAQVRDPRLLNAEALEKEMARSIESISDIKNIKIEDVKFDGKFFERVLVASLEREISIALAALPEVSNLSKAGQDYIAGSVAQFYQNNVKNWKKLSQLEEAVETASKNARSYINAISANKELDIPEGKLQENLIACMTMAQSVSVDGKGMPASLKDASHARRITDAQYDHLSKVVARQLIDTIGKDASDSIIKGALQNLHIYPQDLQDTLKPLLTDKDNKPLSAAAKEELFGKIIIEGFKSAAISPAYIQEMYDLENKNGRLMPKLMNDLVEIIQKQGEGLSAAQLQQLIKDSVEKNLKEERAYEAEQRLEEGFADYDLYERKAARFFKEKEAEKHIPAPFTEEEKKERHYDILLLGKQLRDSADKIRKETNKDKIDNALDYGIGGGIVLGILGLILAPVTGGASLALVFGGIAAGLYGYHKKEKEIQDKIADAEKEILGKQYEEMLKAQRDKAVPKKSADEVKANLERIAKLNQLKSTGKTDEFGQLYNTQAPAGLRDTYGKGLFTFATRNIAQDAEGKVLEEKNVLVIKDASTEIAFKNKFKDFLTGGKNHVLERMPGKNGEILYLVADIPERLEALHKGLRQEYGAPDYRMNKGKAHVEVVGSYGSMNHKNVQDPKFEGAFELRSKTVLGSDGKYHTNYYIKAAEADAKMLGFGAVEKALTDKGLTKGPSYTRSNKAERIQQGKPGYDGFVHLELKVETASDLQFVKDAMEQHYGVSTLAGVGVQMRRHGMDTAQQQPTGNGVPSAPMRTGGNKPELPAANKTVTPSVF